MTQVIAKIKQDKYKTVVEAGNHEFLADEPKPMGKDTGRFGYVCNYDSQDVRRP